MMYLVLTVDGGLDWLGQYYDLAEATKEAKSWTEDGEERFAFVVPIVAVFQTGID